MGRNILDDAVRIIIPVKKGILRRKIKCQVPDGWKRYKPPEQLNTGRSCHIYTTTDGSFTVDCKYEKEYPFGKCPDYPCDLIKTVREAYDKKIGRKKQARPRTRRKI